MPAEAPDFLLSNRTVVITGGGGILGTRVTQALARAGARVAVIEPDLAKAEAACAGVDAGLAGEALPFAADVTDPASVERALLGIEAAFGQVDGLINNAAVKSENFFEPFETFPLADWKQVMDVNLNGAFVCCQVFGRGMAQRKRGAIINTLSIYGVVAPDQRIYEGSMYEGYAINTPAVYSASKAGMLGLTRYLAAYWGHCGVRVNAVSPGGVFSGQNDTFVKRYSERVPMGRMARDDEMSGAAIYLLSDAASYVTGQNLVIDGGLSAW
jgi:NAD(P)-dependent dehydrogenase (short-subunit alcohol dehydrogenase family)